jgi:glycosyltransferase involved in cell wall biosynthesis
MMPLVSILIPAYNAEHWLEGTLRSAIGQTWPRTEIIVVDDGSSDQTLLIARQFASDSVRIFTQHNQGAAATRNNAFSLCHGDYIQWLDADDLLGPEKITKQMELVAAGAARRTLLSACWGQFLYRPDRAQFIPTALWCDLSPSEFLLRKLAHRLFMQTATWLVSRELTEAAGPWDTTMLSDDDGEYFCRVLLASDGIRFAPEARVYYRCVGTTSLSYIGQSNRKLEAMWKSMQLHMGYLRSMEDSTRVRAACLRYLQNYLIDFYSLRPDIVEQMHQTAKALGGNLKPPYLSWKYVWIKVLFGWRCARRAQLLLPSIKGSFIRRWDDALFRLNGRKLAEIMVHGRR